MSRGRVRLSAARARVWRRCGIFLTSALFVIPLLGWGSLPVRAGTLSEVLGDGAFSICADPDALPFSSQAGDPPGLQIDLAQAIAKGLGVRLDVDWIFFRALARHVGCDAFITSVDQSGVAEESELPHAKEPQALTRPYARVRTRVVTREDAPALHSFADLRGTVVAVPPGSYLHYLLDTHHVRVRTLWRTDLEILDAVARGKVPAGVASDWNLGWYLKTHPNAHIRAQQGLVLEPDLDYNVAVTLRNSDPKLVLAVNRILGALMESGRIAEIFKKYGIPYQPPLTH